MPRTPPSISPALPRQAPAGGRRLPGLVWAVASVALHGAVVLVAGRGLSHPVSTSPVAAPEAVRGETFEVPTEGVSLDEATHEPASPSGYAGELDEGDSSPATASPPPSPAGATVRASQSAHARGSRKSGGPASSAAAGAEGPSGPPPPFGAVGDRAAVALAGAFTRSFPQAASADGLWLTAPFGPAGTVDVVFTLDDQGGLVSARREGGHAESAALVEGLRRTLALLRARTFVAAGRVTRLRVTATVSPDVVHDGLHGEVFAIGGSFEGGEGNAFFALAVGRRVDIRVREVR